MAAQPIFEWEDSPRRQPGIPLASGFQYIPEEGSEAIRMLERFRVDTKLAMARRLISEEFPCVRAELLDETSEEGDPIKVFEIHAEINNENLAAVTRISRIWDQTYADSDFEFVLWA